MKTHGRSHHLYPTSADLRPADQQKVKPTPQFKPMLAKDADLARLRFPLIVQPKLDGIRCSIVNGKALTRTLKEVPNREIFEYLSDPKFEGLDGEIVVNDPTADDAYRTTVSFVMSRSKTGADWMFYVFDHFNPPETPFKDRYLDLFARESFLDERIDTWPGLEIDCMKDLEYNEELLVDLGYEGLILRDPSAPYKFGRSGKTGPLLKLKRFTDGEAVIVGVEEEMHNANEAKRNELGRTERSTRKAGLVGKGTLGALIVRDLVTGVEFKIGTGFNAAERADFWYMHVGPPKGLASSWRGSLLIGQTVKYKFFSVGVKDKPRHPVYVGMRSRIDL